MSSARILAGLLILVSAARPLQAQSCPAGPTALVLSGGGAKGLAHIGVLQALDSLGIRPDLVVGSSMGAIVGGLYASGYSAREIDSLARRLPLGDLFRAYEPRVPRSLGLLQPAVVWEEQAGGLVFQRAAVRDGEVNALLNAGFLRGNLAARGDFDSLPIRYRAVATDLLSGEAVVIGRGDLAQAVRASAAIPLLFDPEAMNGRFLGDGGLSANVPIALARREGARRIIVSYTTEPLPDSLNLQSTLVLIDHLIGNLFRQPSDSLGELDVPIRPDIEGFQSLDFSGASIATLVRRGYGAATEALASERCRGVSSAGSPEPGRPFVTDVGIAPSAAEDSLVLTRLLGLTAGERLDFSRFQQQLRRLGTSDRYTSVWLKPSGSRDSVRFELTPRLAAPRIVAVGAAYDNDLGGRIWLGQVSRRMAGRNLEVALAGFFGELSQSVASGVRFTSATSPTWVPAVDARVTREVVRQFVDGDESSPVKVHEASAFAGLELRWPHGWQGKIGTEARVWDRPRGTGEAVIGARFQVVRSGRMAERLFLLDAEYNAAFRRVEIEAITTVELGGLTVRPRARYGAGGSLPSRHLLWFGGGDGFAGLHIGEILTEREFSGSLVFLVRVKGQLQLRLEPMAGVEGGRGVLPDGDVRKGIRAGLNLATGLGPIRLEYGVSDGGRDALLVRLGRWF